jgi:hypothetical protein
MPPAASSAYLRQRFNRNLCVVVPKAVRPKLPRTHAFILSKYARERREIHVADRRRNSRNGQINDPEQFFRSLYARPSAPFAEREPSDFMKSLRKVRWLKSRCESGLCERWALAQISTDKT